MESITVDQLKEKVLGSNPVNIVDVRTDEETAMGVIPGAKKIPMDQIEDNLSYFSDKEKYYIICAAGVRSNKVAEYLNEQGIDAVNVEGGMKAWGDEGTDINSI